MKKALIAVFLTVLFAFGIWLTAEKSVGIQNKMSAPSAGVGGVVS
jgi:hypothetical protein